MSGACSGLLFHHPSLRAMAWFRVASWASDCRAALVPGILQRRILRLYGLELVPGADVGGGLYVAHPSGCTLVVDSMGEDVSVMVSVTIGRLDREQWPSIGDRVFVGACARILGPIAVGDGSVIGANAVVVRDVPPEATAIGVPARWSNFNSNNGSSEVHG